MSIFAWYAKYYLNEHILIYLVSILLLECATMLYASTDATEENALQAAYDRFNRSYNDLQADLFSLSAHNSHENLFAFLQKHKLGESFVAFSCTICLPFLAIS